jgi:hypothetical protein
MIILGRNIEPASFTKSNAAAVEHCRVPRSVLVSIEIVTFGQKREYERAHAREHGTVH